MDELSCFIRIYLNICNCIKRYTCLPITIAVKILMKNYVYKKEEKNVSRIIESDS